MTAFRVFKQVPRLLFGGGSLSRLQELLPVREGKTGYYAFVIDDALRAHGMLARLPVESRDWIEWFPATLHEPSTAQIDEVRDRVRAERGPVLPTAVIGVGGGSTMDVAKALSVMLCNVGS